MGLRKSAAVLLAVILCLAGCGGQVATQSEPSDTAAGPAIEDSTKVMVSGDMDNLQLDDPALPVYDTYTVKERQEQGLAVAMPKLVPYKPKEGKIAYLTFDDGPEDVNTPAVLDILAENGVPATFYVVGKQAKAYPEVLKRIYESGCAIGNHSYDHDYGRLYASPAAYIAEMERADEAIRSIIGVRPLITRAPGGVIGHFNKSYWSSLAAAGYVEHDWNISSADAAPNHPVAQDFIDNIRGQASGANAPSSAIILMHSSSGHEETVKALPIIIQILKEQGYRFGVITPMTPQPW